MVFTQSFMAKVRKVWSRQGVLGKLIWLTLVPFSVGFSAIVWVRNFLYDYNVLCSQSPPLHIISVGNLTVGGTGKTPFVLWLARTLQQRQHRVGILSRGYKGQNDAITLVGTNGCAQATPQQVGDEAVMMARTFTGVVLTGRDRAQAAQLAHENYSVDVMILDDGFQHRQLGRSLDLLLVNTQQGNNDWLLPAGPQREPKIAMRRADIVILTKGEVLQDQAAPQPPLADMHGKPYFFAHPRPKVLIHSEQGEWRELPISLLGHKKVMTVSGIVDPTLFHRFVVEAEAEIAEVMEFPDHHVYTQRDWQTITAASQAYDFVVTTEKDLVKLEQFPFATDKLVALRIDMIVTDADTLLTHIEQRLSESPQ